MGEERCPGVGTSKQQVESLMPSPAAASDHTSPAPWPLPVLGDWDGGVGWSREAIRPEAVSRPFSNRQPRSAFLSFLRVLPSPTPSHNASTEQCTHGKTESEDLSQDLNPPQRSGLPEPTCYSLQESVHSVGSCPDRPPGKDHVLLARNLQLMAQSWAGLLCSSYSMNQ